MMGREGLIKVEYEGCLSAGLREHLEAVRGVRVTGLRPLTLLVEKPVAVLNQIYRYLTDGDMDVRRITVKGSSAAA